MSTQRNTARRVTRQRHIVAAFAIAVPVAATLAACSADSVTSPATGTQGPTALLAPAPAPTPKQSPTDDGKKLSPTQLAVASTTWQTTSADVQPGTDSPLGLTCGWTGMYSVSKVVGSAGDTLRLGRSYVAIPKGALTQQVQISATVSVGRSVTIDFSPHGQKFAKPVTIRADYSGCTAPTGGAFDFYYLTDYGKIAQTMPSADVRSQNAITALTDHFSTYLVAYGRY